MNELVLKERVIVVTGGAGLIGQTFVRSIAAEGGVAVIGDVDPDSGRMVADKIAREFNDSMVEFVPLDITSRESVTSMIQSIHARHGKIDALVNNAYPRNKNYGRAFFDVEYEDFCENVNLHLGGYFLVSQEISRFYIQQGYGNIVNIASVYGVAAPRFNIYSGTKMTVPVEYAAVKSALIHLTKYLASYLKGKNIRVNCISPGGILADQPESFLSSYKTYCSDKGMLEAVDLTGALLFLLSESSRYVNGQNIVVDDGFTL